MPTRPPALRAAGTIADVTADGVSELLTRRVAQVVERDALEAMLRGTRPLRVKLGFDPTTADLHIGHGVVLERLRAFQDLGHTAVLVVGDTTAQIGDPSERNATRPMLTAEQVKDNAQTYLDPVPPGRAAKRGPRSAGSPSGSTRSACARSSGC